MSQEPDRDQAWLEGVYTRHLGVRVFLKLRDDYWVAWTKEHGEHRLTDLIKMFDKQKSAAILD